MMHKRSDPSPTLNILGTSGVGMHRSQSAYLLYIIDGYVLAGWYIVHGGCESVHISGH